MCGSRKDVTGPEGFTVWDGDIEQEPLKGATLGKDPNSHWFEIKVNDTKMPESCLQVEMLAVCLWGKSQAVQSFSKTATLLLSLLLKVSRSARRCGRWHFHLPVK